MLRSTQDESERSRSSFDEPPRRPATYEVNEDVDEDIINMKDVRIMMKITQCSMEAAINRLQKAKGNLELAIDLVYSESSTLDHHAEETPERQANGSGFTQQNNIATNQEISPPPVIRKAQETSVNGTSNEARSSPPRCRPGGHSMGTPKTQLLGNAYQQHHQNQQKLWGHAVALGMAL